MQGLIENLNVPKEWYCHIRKRVVIDIVSRVLVMLAYIGYQVNPKLKGLVTRHRRNRNRCHDLLLIRDLLPQSLTQRK